MRDKQRREKKRLLISGGNIMVKGGAPGAGEGISCSTQRTPHRSSWLLPKELWPMEDPHWSWFSLTRLQPMEHPMLEHGKEWGGKRSREKWLCTDCNPTPQSPGMAWWGAKESGVKDWSGAWEKGKERWFCICLLVSHYQILELNIHFNWQ